MLTVLGERRRSRRLPELLRSTTDPAALADGFGAWSDLPAERKLELLEATDARGRVELALDAGRDLLAEHELQERIRHEVTDGMETQQREFLLRQQLQAIRKELGDEDDEDGADDVPRAGGRGATCPRPCAPRSTARSPSWSARRAEPRAGLDPHVARHDPRPAVGRPLRRGPRRHRTRAACSTPTTPGSTDVKDRIVEYLAVRKLRADRGFDRTTTTTTAPTRRGDGLILALVGPPGVGKTSLGESVARATGR